MITLSPSSVDYLLAQSDLLELPPTDRHDIPHRQARSLESITRRLDGFEILTTVLLILIWLLEAGQVQAHIAHAPQVLHLIRVSKEHSEAVSVLAWIVLSGRRIGSAISKAVRSPIPKS